MTTNPIDYNERIDLLEQKIAHLKFILMAELLMVTHKVQSDRETHLTELLDELERLQKTVATVRSYQKN